MNQLAPKRSLVDQGTTCGELLNMAQRELTALFRAVTELFGAEQAELSAEDWLHEVEAGRALPASTREWRQVTLRVITQLAERCSGPNVIAASAQIQSASY
jgi:plasmid stabilization system protein ParE